jgi:hypothetical protein
MILMRDRAIFVHTACGGSGDNCTDLCACGLELCVPSDTGELLNPAIVWGPIWSPADETRRVSEPAVVVKDGVRHLTYRGRRDTAPGRHRGMLPSGSDRALLGSSLSQN